MIKKGDENDKGNPFMVPKSYIKEHLHKTETAVRSLKQELRALREQNSTIARQRDELLRQGADRRPEREDSTMRLEVDSRGFMNNQRFNEALQSCRSENQELRNQCSELEAALHEERRKHSEAKSVILYLEAQIEQLEAMIVTLREHKRFMRQLDH